MKSNIHIRYFLKLLLILFVCFCSNSLKVLAQNVNIPDANFKSYLISNTSININGDNEIQVSEASAFTGTIDCSRLNITSLEGLGAFTKLTKLYCNQNQLTSLDVTKNKVLLILSCSNNQLTSLDVTKNLELRHLFCDQNLLASLDVTKNTTLTALDCFMNQIRDLDVSQNILLTELNCGVNQLTSLDVTKNTALNSLWCNQNKISNLDVTQNITLAYLGFQYNQLTSVDLSKNTLLKNLICSGNLFASLDVTQNALLQLLYCNENQIGSIDLSQNTALVFFDCTRNQLTNLDVTKNSLLVNLSCSYNQLVSLDVTKNDKLNKLYCNDNLLTSLDVTKNIEIEELNCEVNKLVSIDLSNNIKLIRLYCYSNQFASLDLTKNEYLTYLNCSDNPNLLNICVYNVDAANMNQYFTKDSYQSWVSECAFSIIEQNIGEQSICLMEAQLFTPISVSASGVNMQYQWFSSLVPENTGGVNLGADFQTSSFIPPSTQVGTMYYYCIVTNGSESVSSNVFGPLIVNSFPLTPNVISQINYCIGDIAQPIAATGDNLKWYTSPNAGTASTTAPVPSTNTSGVYLYYVSQSTGACESDRAAIVVNVHSNSTAPDVLSTVDYCIGSTAAPLVVYGSNLKCYNTSTGGISTNMPVIPSTNTIGTTNYFVSQNYNGCESSRSIITVNVHGIPTVPNAATPVNYCLGGISNPLSASGSNLYWYQSVGDCSGTGVSPTPSTSVAGSTSYFVSQTVNGCESAKKEIKVIVNNSVAAPSVVSPLSLFIGVNAPALTASGTNLKWYTSESGGTGSIQAPRPSTVVAGMTDYYVSQTVNGCESQRAQIKVIVNSDISGPTCFNLGATYTFELSPVHTVNASNYSWWVNGSVQSIVNSNIPKATISVGQYYTTGQVCVGINYNQSPWYKQICTSTIGLCSNGSSSAYRMGNGNATALVEVSPNPSIDNFNIQAFSSIKQITIKNMLGQEVYSIGDMSENQTINFGTELASGMYIIQYMAEDGLKHTVSIIKQ